MTTKTTEKLDQQTAALARVSIEEIDPEARLLAEENADERFEALCQLSDEEMDAQAREWEALKNSAPF